MYRGGVSLRTLRIWIEKLPQESSTKTEMRNAVTPEQMERARTEYRPDLAPWSRVEIFLAELRDEIVLSRSVAIAAAGGKPPEFTPTSRPGIPPNVTPRKGMTDDQRRALDPRLRNQPKEA
ncbi:hypothetical protein [Streptomyces sp. NTK 937]|uniref:hypothetical protein n=1 Tax=Streptomyces sp. NTK 937 TaxID=1487711 RepID=UPI0004A939DD|nr:hypothetical protein [Streptomyces sp. NTK 937]KDQ65758.1 hypothetical protein DT87_00445 [Streptomyces sp. NTK 937]